MNTQPIISFKNFSFKYKAQSEPTLTNINLDIYLGEKVLIVGSSGSGKSTLANCINGLIPFSYKGDITGSCTIFNNETSQQNIFEISKHVGSVLQDTDDQFIGLTSAEDIAFLLENKCVSQQEMIEKVTEISKITGIKSNDARGHIDLLEMSPYDLSGGQKQRVSMAGVLVGDVQVMLFDEPLANLDPATGKQTISLIDSIHKQTKNTIVIIEHRIEDVLYEPVDRIVVMDSGHIVYNGDPAQLLQTNILQSHGLREPLDITALKYIGINNFDINSLTQSQKQQVQEWNHENVNGNVNIDGNINIEKNISFDEKSNIINVNNVSFRYQDDKPEIIKNVNFSIKKGEIVSIVGTNGAGKSTMAKLLCAFIKPSTGNIKVFEQDTSQLTIAQAAKTIGYVMQNPNHMICKSMIYDEVALALVNSGMPTNNIQEKVHNILKTCGLYSFRNWPVSALSYGQKKRLTIASILVTGPDILVLDEPTAGQDYKHYTEIMTFLKELQQLGITIIMITHDMHLMLEYTDRAIVFKDGQIIADTHPAILLCDPNLSNQASLKETSLFHLAKQCGIDDQPQFVQNFIRYEKTLGNHITND